MSYEPENPTSDLPPDAQAWLFREFTNIQRELLRKTTAGNAGLYLSAPQTVTNTITPTPQKIEGFDQKITNEIEARAWIGNNSIRFNDIGSWVVMVQVILVVTSSSANTAREVALQFYNETDSQVIDVITGSSIPRYGTLTTIPCSVMVNITPALLAKEYVLRIYSPSGDTINVTRQEIMDFNVHRTSVEV